MPASNIIVHGRVQGVGYRYFVLTLAHEYGIDGEVWNRRDGSVEVIASHVDPDVLADFEEGLKDGPGRVRQISPSPRQLPVQPGFRITDSR